MVSAMPCHPSPSVPLPLTLFHYYCHQYPAFHQIVIRPHQFGVGTAENPLPLLLCVAYDPSTTRGINLGIRWVGAGRLTSVTAYNFTSVPGAFLSAMAPGITRPAAAICITNINNLHPGSGHNSYQDTSSRGRRRPWLRQSSDEEPMGHIISQSLGHLVAS